MRRITAIPSKKITFKNAPVSGLFFYKRTLYKKISVREACCYREQKTMYFENDKIVRFIAKHHENIAIDLYQSKKTFDQDNEYKINDVIEIISKSILGKIVSINKNSCLIQYKNEGSVSFDEFSYSDIRKISQ